VQGSLCSLCDFAITLYFGTTDGGRVRRRRSIIGLVTDLSFGSQHVLMLGEIYGLRNGVEGVGVHLE